MAHFKIIAAFKVEDAVDSPNRRDGAGLMLAVKDCKTPTLVAYKLRFTDRGYLDGAVAAVNALGKVTAESWVELDMKRWLIDKSVVTMDGDVIKDRSAIKPAEFNDDPDAVHTPTYELPKQLTRKAKGWSLT